MTSLRLQFIHEPPANSRLSPWQPEWFQQQADAHLAVLDPDQFEVARGSLWWTHAPPHPGHRPGILGHFAAASLEAARKLLDGACERLREAGCTLAIGPMDGNTWRKYRLVTEPGTEPPFFLEPANPPEWPGYFVSAGFAVLATYTSSLNSDLSKRDPRADRAAERLRKAGVAIRPLDPADFADELRKIHAVSAVSFTHNFLYTELAESTFLAQYLPIQSKVRPELVLLAEHEGRPVGYLFAIPDFAQAQRGETIDTVIGKTLAVLPGKSYGGLGVVLTDELQRTAHRLGYRRVIHALQHEQNNVRNMSEFYGPVMRRYALFARALE
ncbi:MAG TPA: hypothetical protein VIS74_02430 [Chthoniobacterales bacterium]